MSQQPKCSGRPPVELANVRYWRRPTFAGESRAAAPSLISADRGMDPNDWSSCLKPARSSFGEAPSEPDGTTHASASIATFWPSRRNVGLRRAATFMCREIELSTPMHRRRMVRSAPRRPDAQRLADRVAGIGITAGYTTVANGSSGTSHQAARAASRSTPSTSVPSGGTLNMRTWK